MEAYGCFKNEFMRFNTHQEFFKMQIWFSFTPVQEKGKFEKKRGKPIKWNELTGNARNFT